MVFHEAGQLPHEMKRGGNFKKKKKHIVYAFSHSQIYKIINSSNPSQKRLVTLLNGHFIIHIDKGEKLSFS